MTNPAGRPDISGLPKLQRPHPELAVSYAQQLFLAGERVELNTLADALGVGRTTLYRWVGSREQLIAAALSGLAPGVFAAAAKLARGEGLARALDVIAKFMELTATFEPLRQFADREPQLALRVLLASDGKVAEALRTGFQRALDTHLGAGTVDRDSVEIMVQLATALEWAPITIGQNPEIE